ncbi:hypothetical protein Tco_1176918 [Tanacetum coccineum]
MSTIEWSKLCKDFIKAPSSLCSGRDDFLLGLQCRTEYQRHPSLLPLPSQFSSECNQESFKYLKGNPKHRLGTQKMSPFLVGSLSVTVIKAGSHGDRKSTYRIFGIAEPNAGISFQLHEYHNLHRQPEHHMHCEENTILPAGAFGISAGSYGFMRLISVLHAGRTYSAVDVNTADKHCLSSCCTAWISAVGGLFLLAEYIFIAAWVGRGKRSSPETELYNSKISLELKIARHTTSTVRSYEPELQHDGPKCCYALLQGGSAVVQQRHTLQPHSPPFSPMLGESPPERQPENRWMYVALKDNHVWHLKLWVTSKLLFPSEIEELRGGGVMYFLKQDISRIAACPSLVLIRESSMPDLEIPAEFFLFFAEDHSQATATKKNRQVAVGLAVTAEDLAQDYVPLSALACVRLSWELISTKTTLLSAWTAIRNGRSETTSGCAAHNGTITMKAVKAMSKQQLIEEYENICRCLEKDRLLSAQYNLFRPKPAITEPPSKRQRFYSSAGSAPPFLALLLPLLQSGVSPFADSDTSSSPSPVSTDHIPIDVLFEPTSGGINEFFLASDEDEQIGMSRYATADPDSDDKGTVIQIRSAAYETPKSACICSSACTARQMVFSSPMLTAKKESSGSKPLQTGFVCNSNPLIAM